MCIGHNGTIDRSMTVITIMISGTLNSLQFPTHRDFYGLFFDSQRSLGVLVSIKKLFEMHKSSGILKKQTISKNLVLSFGAT